jgi:hypothetical protein
LMEVHLRCPKITSSSLIVMQWDGAI